MSRREPDAPPGRRTDPTSPAHRLRLAALAAVGLAVAGYLTLFQLGAVDSPWDPLFDPRPVLELTEPVPDAPAGVLAYATELLLLIPGGRDRRRTRPWACRALGLVLTSGFVVSIALVVIQPTVAGAWCTLCLVSALLSVLLFVVGIGEAQVAWRHVRRARGHGASWADAVAGRAARVS